MTVKIKLQAKDGNCEDLPGGSEAGSSGNIVVSEWNTKNIH